MKILFTLFFVGLGLLHACTICAQDALMINASMQFHLKNKVLQKVRITWEMHPNFSQMVIADYDKNRDNTLDKQEQKVLLERLSMLKESNYMTNIAINEKKVPVKSLTNFQPSINNGIVTYSFDVPLEYKIDRNSLLTLFFYDPYEMIGMVYEVEKIGIKTDKSVETRIDYEQKVDEAIGLIKYELNLKMLP